MRSFRHFCRSKHFEFATFNSIIYRIATGPVDILCVILPLSNMIMKLFINFGEFQIKIFHTIKIEKVKKILTLHSRFSEHCAFPVIIIIIHIFYNNSIPFLFFIKFLTGINISISLISFSRKKAV